MKECLLRSMRNTPHMLAASSSENSILFLIPYRSYELMYEDFQLLSRRKQIINSGMDPEDIELNLTLI